jgi:hypothetical protein
MPLLSDTYIYKDSEFVLSMSQKKLGRFLREKFVRNPYIEWVNWPAFRDKVTAASTKPGDKIVRLWRQAPARAKDRARGQG